MKFKKIGSISSKLQALLDGHVLTDSRFFYKIIDEELFYFNVENQSWIEAKHNFKFIKELTEDIYIQYEWYHNIPEKGILCISDDKKIYLATRKCNGLYSDQVELDHYGCRIHISRLRPLTKEELLERCGV